ncbi:MAG TPA: ABC transporter substrate-binding protein [Acidimicrobiia bacterium]|nr:ABC transporter substrate-binding protein [Acidimicrobiia bacterium]
MHRSKSRGAIAAAVAVVAGLASTALTAAPGQATPAARGVSNGTITVAGIGFVQNFADAAVGAQARFARFNKTNEIKGLKIDFKEFADDKNDPATALSETRRLVTQDGIFALVPDLSLATPGDYLTQQQVPWFGPGYDATYCPTGKAGWGFSQYGCLIPENPKKLPSPTAEQLKKVLAAKGISNPTIALLGTDAESGKKSIQNSASVYTGAGWKVVYAKGAFPAPPAVVGDYTPYVQALLKSNNGGQPDVIYSSIAPASSLQLFNLIKSSGYTGTFISPFYTPLLLKALQGAYVFLQQAPFETTSANMTQMKNDIQSFKPGTQYSLTVGGGYLAADFFIAALKKAGKNPTGASVQKAASKMTYQWKDVVGPIKYPASYKYSVPACASLVYDPDGTAFQVVQPYTCSTKTYPILSKFASQ